MLLKVNKFDSTILINAFCEVDDCNTSGNTSIGMFFELIKEILCPNKHSNMVELENDFFQEIEAYESWDCVNVVRLAYCVCPAIFLKQESSNYFCGELERKVFNINDCILRYRNNFKFVKFYLQIAKEVNLKIIDEDVLLLAISLSRDFDACNLLCEAAMHFGFDFNKTCQINNFQAFKMIRDNFDRIPELSLESIKNKTFLEIALQEYNDVSVQLFLEHGLNFLAQNWENHSPLSIFLMDLYYVFDKSQFYYICRNWQGPRYKVTRNRYQTQIYVDQIIGTIKILTKYLEKLSQTESDNSYMLKSIAALSSYKLILSKFKQS